MKKKFHLFILTILLFVLQFYSSLRAQIYSDAPIIITDKNEILTDMIYVKFKPNDLIKIPSSDVQTDGNSISIKYPDIRKTFIDYCTKWNLSLSELKFSKAIPQAKEDDTIYVDNITGETKKLPNLAKVFIVRFPKPVEVESIMSSLRILPEVEYTHGPVQWVNCVETPNDQKYVDGSQWYLNTIQSPGAWGISKGNSNIKIALIESGGVELTHIDLQSKIVGGDNNPGGILDGHGTRVTGIAGAITNNIEGIASLGWNVSLLTYQPYNDDSVRTVLSQKIRDAVDAGASVINCSFKTIKSDFTSCGSLSNQKENNTLLNYTIIITGIMN